MVSTEARTTDRQTDGGGCTGALFRVYVFARWLLRVGELFEEERAFDAHLLDRTVKTQLALTCSVIGLFDLVQSSLEVDAFVVVGAFHGRREWGVLHG